VGKDSYNLDDC
jgi:hypothetical protein